MLLLFFFLMYNVLILYAFHNGYIDLMKVGAANYLFLMGILIHKGYELYNSQIPREDILDDNIDNL